MTARRSTPARDRRIWAGYRAVMVLMCAALPALLALTFVPQRPWELTVVEDWGQLVFLIIAGAQGLLAVVIAAQALVIARERDRPESTGGSDLLTVLSIVAIVVGVGLALARGVPGGSGPVLLGVQVLFGAAVAGLSVANGVSLRRAHHRSG